MVTDKKQLRIKIGFVVLNCLLTIFHQFIYNYEPTSDSLRYLSLAKQYSELNFFDPSANCYGHSLYSFFLFVIGFIFSYHHFVVGLFQTILFSIVTLLLVSEIEKSYKKKMTIALFSVAFIPDIYFFNGIILTESLSFSFILFSFYCALKIYNKDEISLKAIIILSVSVSITILNRIETAVIIFPILFLIYPVLRQKIATYIFLFVGIIFISLQWNGYRNYKIYGIYKLSAFNGGEVIYGGNNKSLDGSHHAFWTSPFKELFIPNDKIETLDKISSLPPQIAFPKRDSLFMQLAIEAWKQNPLQQIKVIPNKLAKNWLLPGIFDIYTGDTSKTQGLQLKKILSKEYFNNKWYAPYKHLFYILIHWTILIIIIVGIIQRNKVNRFQKSVLILLSLWLLFAIPFCGLPRWHIGILPLLFLSFIPCSLITKTNTLIEKLNIKT